MNSHAAHSPTDKRKAALLSLYTNLLLMLLKVAVGVLSGSVSVLSEAAHSASDLVASGIAVFSVRIADLPPDELHPYGHGKAESLAALAQALLLLGAATLIIYEAIARLLQHAGPQRVELGMAIMAVSALANIGVVRYMLRVAGQTQSQALAADAENHRVDIYTAAGVLLGLLLVRLTGYSFFDPLLAIAVALLIMNTTWRLMHEALATLMDTHLPAEDVEMVRQVLHDDPSVLGYHKLRTRIAGSVRHVDAHVLMDDELSLAQAHDLTEQVEDRIREALPNTEVTLHTEPYHAEQRHQSEDH
ncbi:MAG: cation transporter [Abitibacteriaceae bacterium]|nr:cation transporter [Abditibacteriaceae bacterium]MBV9865986.1 cation transporter [Abditibacteriaceae bacterium]